MITTDKMVHTDFHTLSKAMKGDAHMENGYIYIRVSTLIQVDGFSLDAQEEEIRAFAKMHDINIVGRYSDEGKSGKNAEHRPAFNQMMDDIRSKKDNIKYVLVCIKFILFK